MLMLLVNREVAASEWDDARLRSEARWSWQTSV